MPNTQTEPRTAIRAASLPESTLAFIEEDYRAGLKAGEIRQHLTDEGVPTLNGRPWHQGTVQRICDRLDTPSDELSYEDPANARFEGLVVVLCGDCDEKFLKLDKLAHHTWANHGRMPTRAERTPTGEDPFLELGHNGKNGRGKLNAYQVGEIKSKLRAGTHTQAALSREYNIAASVIYDIKMGRTWVHVQ